MRSLHGCCSDISAFKKQHRIDSPRILTSCRGEVVVCDLCPKFPPALLREAGWSVSDRRIERLWRREGLKVPQKQAKKGRLWLNDGSCVRLRPEYRNHVWSYDFVHCRTDDGKVLRTLNILDEFSRE